MSAADAIFQANCAMCHRTSGQGQANLFPALTDNDWQWGNSLDQIEQSLRAGRRAMMPAWNASLDEGKVDQVAGYIRTMGNGGKIPGNDPGRQIYNQYLYRLSWDGNPMLGAPNLTDDIWLYGGSGSALRSTISNGRAGVMPAFQDRLDEVQIRLLLAWLSR